MVWGAPTYATAAAPGISALSTALYLHSANPLLSLSPTWAVAIT